MKNLIMLVGNIGSGKSTFSKKYQEKDYVVIARDQLRYAIGNGKYVFNVDYEHIIWNTEYYLYKSFLRLGENIVVDEIGISKKLRQRYIRLAKKKGYKITVIEMPRFCMGEAVNRRMINPHGQYNVKVWKEVWTRFESMYEEPSKKEGIDEIVKIKKEEVS